MNLIEIVLKSTSLVRSNNLGLFVFYSLFIYNQQFVYLWILLYFWIIL